jgi:hypothetical protein
MLTPQRGPIVVLRKASRIYFPFEVAGFLSESAFIIDAIFSINCDSEKEILPTGTWMFFPESTRKVALPA